MVFGRASASTERATARPATQLSASTLAIPRTRGWILSPALLFGLALFALALAPRWVRYETAYATMDEALWMRSAGSFAYALNHGNLEQTFQSGHPGVLAIELALLGLGPAAERFGDPMTGAVFDRDVTAVPGYFEALVQGKQAVALATSITVAAIGLLAWRLIGPGPALAASLLLAFEPYHLAKSQQVTTDAALSDCMVLALLCSLMRWGKDGGRRWAIASGVLFGLATLAKVTALYLGLFIPMLALVLGWRHGARRLVLDLALWGTAALASFIALWPSMWVEPLNTISRVIAFALYKGGQPHASGNFFFGQVVPDPGPLYYPVATLLRLGTASTVGLIVLAAVGWPAHRLFRQEHRRLILSLLAYVLGFVLFMTLGAKKLNSYVLPILPILDLLAGLGLWLALRRWRERGMQPASKPGSRIFVARPGLLLALSVLLALAVWPVATQSSHYLAYYNPLLGGGPVAERAMLVGEGEGLEQVARWLNARSDAGSLTVAANAADVLQSMFVGKAIELRSQVPRTADYVVIYVAHNQLRRSPRVVADYGAQRPKYVVRLDGIEYARVYSGPGPGGQKS